MTDVFLRFIIGGFVVSGFATIALLLKPKTFAGLFGAAPSVALATITMTASRQGKAYAAIEARSMIAGAVAFLAYAALVSWLSKRDVANTLVLTSSAISLWFGVAFGLWYLFLR